jgi:hypothetical protein
MGGRSRLAGGLPRVFPDHRAALARAYRQEFEALGATLALDGDPLLQREVARVAFLAIRAQESARRWAVAVERRRVGRGRRPSSRAVERAARRAALDDASYAAAVDRLRDQAGNGHSRRVPTPAELLAGLQEAQRAC